MARAVIGSVEPSLKVPVTASACVSPVVRVTVAGVAASDWSVGTLNGDGLPGSQPASGRPRVTATETRANNRAMLFMRPPLETAFKS